MTDASHCKKRPSAELKKAIASADQGYYSIAGRVSLISTFVCRIAALA
jgi:hypothetical protein